MSKSTSVALFSCLVSLGAACSNQISSERVEMCNNFMAQEPELFVGYEDARLGPAEPVGETFYTAKIGGAVESLPETAFFCTWSIDKQDEKEKWVTIIFVPKTTYQNSDTPILLFELEETGKGNNTLRRIDFRQQR